MSSGDNPGSGGLGRNKRGELGKQLVEWSACRVLTPVRNTLPWLVCQLVIGEDGGDAGEHDGDAGTDAGELVRMEGTLVRMEGDAGEDGGGCW